MAREHTYSVELDWTGNAGSGTSSYSAYSRDHELRAAGKPPIPGSADPGFRGDPARWNPEELLVASLAACHQLWYLHLCAIAGIVVESYSDRASGVMVEEDAGAGQFAGVTLRPHARLAPAPTSRRRVACTRKRRGGALSRDPCRFRFAMNRALQTRALPLIFRYENPLTRS